jgi:hypothetical protein
LCVAWSSALTNERDPTVPIAPVIARLARASIIKNQAFCPLRPIGRIENGRKIKDIGPGDGSPKSGTSSSKYSFHSKGAPKTGFEVSPFGPTFPLPVEGLGRQCISEHRTCPRQGCALAQGSGRSHCPSEIREPCCAVDATSPYPRLASLGCWVSSERHGGWR